MSPTLFRFDRSLAGPFLVAVAALVSGCATTQGGAGSAMPSLSSLPNPLNIQASDLTDAVNPTMREFKALAAKGDFNGAEQLLHREGDYFAKRFGDHAQALPPEAVKLAEYVWTHRYRDRIERSLAEMRAIAVAADLLEPSRWSTQAEQFERARWSALEFAGDRSVALLRVDPAPGKALAAEVERVRALALSQRPDALAATFARVLNTGTHEGKYVVGEFGLSDYLGSAAFQQLALERLLGLRDAASLSQAAQKLSVYLSKPSQQAVDEQFVALVRERLMADGRVSLEEVSSLAAVKTPFGSGADSLASMVRVGYVDLTSASFRNRNIFDFEVAFERDLPMTFTPADESVFRTQNLSGFDYLFVTDLALAKVSREFRSRRDVKSRVQTGVREQPNPDYVTALSNYQKAMAEFQRAQLSAAVPKACYGWGCVIQGLADGIAQGVARGSVDEASQVLARTSQTLSIPVYSEYAYQSVDINAAKTVDVNYYVIDTRARRVLTSNFQITDQETFNVAYNVREADPDRTSILSNVKTEEDVIAWEKRAVPVKLSALFNVDSLRTARVEPLRDIPAFLASLKTRQVVGAAPTYASGSPAAVGASPQERTVVNRNASAASAQTIADSRFDSIVIVQNPSASGTGFYVTPELVLTAYHVVKDSSIVQMTFYDGTKTFGRVVDHDVRLDLALVRAQTAGKPLKIHSGPLRLGETVEAIGHPKGYEFTITRGVISAVRRQRAPGLGSDLLVEFVQTDTPISPGNSGGPLLLGDVVIGVNDWIRVDKGSQNLNFSVSYNEIRSFLDRYTSR